MAEQAASILDSIEAFAQIRERPKIAHILEVPLAHLRIVNEALDWEFQIQEGAVAPIEHQQLARGVLDSLAPCMLVDGVLGLDYALELRNRALLVSPTVNRAAYLFLIRVAGTSSGLERENHGFGYHFHYCDVFQKVERTDVLLTFDPSEALGPPDSLYWEHHGPYRAAKPSNWSRKRRLAIHSAAKPSLRSPGKQHFASPGAGAHVLART